MTQSERPDISRTVLAVAREIGGVEISPEDDLVARGLDSIEMLHVSQRLSAELDLQCGIDDLFRTASVRELIDLLGARAAAS